ncbi:glycosyltransferase [Agrococcus sp. Marseille-P2731]|uniref:glycosyltransferase n=1 Tax=Agrococcus sp. Marseille-P2731 TaxID=1841862 RepID=UPI000930BA23|nr:glycosyltransferase [Agrococcus sp. Marseille-P2731]
MPADADRRHAAAEILGRAPRLIGNASMAATTAARSVLDDPLTFGIQLARRFPAARGPLLAAALAARGADRRLVETWLSGDMAATRAQLDETALRGSLSRLAAEVAQAAGRPELVVDDERVHAVARARAAWQIGEATLAISLLERHAPGSRLHRALRAELALMTPGTRLRWTPRGDAAPLAAGRGVLHLLTNSLPHTQSGYTVRSHEVLRAQRAAGLDPVAMTRVGYPVVVGGLGAAAVDVIDDIAYHRALPARLAPTPDGRLGQQADALAALAGRVRPAVLQTTTHYPNAVVVREVADALRLPWAYEVRGMLEQTWVAGLGSDAARERATQSERFRLTREREAELASAADAVFTLSGSMRDDLAGRGVPRERVHLVPNGIDQRLLQRRSPTPAAARASLGLPSEGFWVGSTSSLVDYEGFDVLLDAVASARADGHDVRALLVGDGASRQALESRARSRGLAEHAVFTGRVARDEVVNYRDALDVFVVPRHDREVTRTVSPLKPIEAMASGRPLVVSALPPLIETIGDALVEAGFTAPPGDADALARRLVELMHDEPARAAAVRLGRARAAERTWGAIGATYRAQINAASA